MNIAEYRAKMLKGEPIVATTRKAGPRRIAKRMYELTPYRIRLVRGRYYAKKFDSVIVTASQKSEKTAELKQQGFARVDCVEIETTVNEQKAHVSVIEKYKVRTIAQTKRRKLEFSEQIFAAAKGKFIPKLPEGLTVKSVENAWAMPQDYKPIVKVKDRQNKAKVEEQRIRLFNKLNSKSTRPRMAIFDRKSGGFLFASADESEIVNFINSQNLVLEDIILYVPNEVFWMLRELEG